MATPFNKVYSFVQELGQKSHNLASDTLKMALTDAAPGLGNTVLANITQIGATGGYLAGGFDLKANGTGIQWTNASGISKLVIADYLHTATTGGTPQFRYAVLYNATSVGGMLLGWYDYGQECALSVGETFNFDFDGANGVATFQ